MQGAKAAEGTAQAAVEVVPLPSSEDGESTTIYVKNLAFATTDAGLQVSLVLHRLLVLFSQGCCRVQHRGGSKHWPRHPD